MRLAEHTLGSVAVMAWDSSPSLAEIPTLTLPLVPLLAPRAWEQLSATVVGQPVALARALASTLVVV